MRKAAVFCLTFFITLLWPVFSKAGNNGPFAMEFTYDEQNRLVVVIERFSQDEVGHAMRVLRIFKNDQLAFEEDLSRDNHTNRVTKKFPLTVNQDDEIKAELHYGEGQVFSKLVKIGIETISSATQSSVLVPDEKIADEAPKIQEMPEPKSVLEQKAKEEKYGYKDYGYKIEGKDYGYKVKSESYGYQMSDEEFGYKDEGNKDLGQEDYGYKRMGYESQDPTYGRGEYQK